MNDPSDAKLEALLRRRRLARARPDLAERIILRAKALPQRKDAPLWQAIKEIFAEFHVPRPAYALAAALALGMVVGFNAPWDTAAPSDRGAAQGFLASDEGFL